MYKTKEEGFANGVPHRGRHRTMTSTAKSTSLSLTGKPHRPKYFMLSVTGTGLKVQSEETSETEREGKKERKKEGKKDTKKKEG